MSNCVKKTFGSYGKDGEEKARVVCAYINKTMVICNEHPFEVVDLGDTGHFWDQHWCIQANSDLFKYNKSLDEVRNAIKDYWAGYQDGKKASGR